MKKGCLALVLHAHIPFVRHPEHDASLEENWLFEAITESYIPLLLVMEDLVKDGIDFRLTMSISPTLSSMLMDPLLQYRYLNRVERLIELAEKEISRTEAQPEFNLPALMYHSRLKKIRNAFIIDYKRDLVKGFKRFQDLGVIEIMASCATHGYLPLLSVNEAAVRAQVRIGVDHFKEIFGRRPQGFWLPECGFSGGIDRALAEHEISHTIVETHGVTRAEPRPRYGVFAPIQCPSGVLVFGRDPESSRQVWSSNEGYPGDHDYREFYRDIGFDLDYEYVRPYLPAGGIRMDTGFKYYRITGNTNQKEIYLPDQAEKKAELHAEDFLLKKEKQVEYLASVMDRTAVLTAPFDAELFGHWWYEGPLWLNHLIRKACSGNRSIRMITLSEYVEEYSHAQVSTPAASSWGKNGFHSTWLNKSNDWIYPHLHHGAQSMERLTHNHPDADGIEIRALNQAARELLMAQASDWAFMIGNNTMSEYGTGRTKTHLMRLERLKNEIENRNIDEKRLKMIECRNNIFPKIDYRLFKGN